MPQNTPESPNPLGPGALSAPWRLSYLQRLDAEDTSKPTSKPEPAPADSPPPVATPPSSSFLDDYWNNPERDHANHVIARTARGMILLNAYPYANGHLLVALGEARPSLLDYDSGSRAELWMLVELASDLMQRTLDPQGINIGINQGRAAGAGIPQHLHVHLVPRWSGDVNFITVVGQVRVIPSALDAMGARYREQWATMRSAGAATGP